MSPGDCRSIDSRMTLTPHHSVVPCVGDILMGIDHENSPRNSSVSSVNCPSITFDLPLPLPLCPSKRLTPSGPSYPLPIPGGPVHLGKNSTATPLWLGHEFGSWMWSTAFHAASMLVNMRNSGIVKADVIWEER